MAPALPVRHDAPLHAVTGALGYTGRSLTEQLLAGGRQVRALTNSPNRPSPFGGSIEVRPLAFHDVGALEALLEGVDVLHNTYWVRFNHRLFNFEEAVHNSQVLFRAAERAGVRRIVHVSILHSREADDLGYYWGKHMVEDALRECGVPHAILRPGVLFGRHDILINNIAWTLRHLPVFGVFGDGAYRLRPFHVDDMARLMIDHAGREGCTEADAVGPETFTFRELAHTLCRILGIRRVVVGMPPSLALTIATCLNPFVGDTVITRQEVQGLMRNLLDSPAPSPVLHPICLTEWAAQHADQLGRRYHSEVARRTNREAAYEQLR
ncbi:MAG TPA: NAD(P)H-binding protein [Phycisphaerales bacterium]|nr:NAD(P)H-binding protein [Phycisphaerales bacterium]